MQRDFNCDTILSKIKSADKREKPYYSKLMCAILTVSFISLSGCQTLKNLTNTDKDDDVVATANKSYDQYYKDAMQSLDKGQYLYAAQQLSELRTFYPTGPNAEDALLTLMYAQFQAKEYDTAAASAEQFIKLYPKNIQVDYAYYLRGVANMQAGNNVFLHLAKLDQAHRDTAYLRLAFNNLQALIARYPNSSYAPDAAQRLSYIYNQFAEHELAVARWYIKREAYVAAVNRAKWVFQYYPLSEQTPEAIAILAFSHEQLGLNDLAQDYKTLLQINYPEWLTSNGQVKLDTGRAGTVLNTITFGKLGRADTSNQSSSTLTGRYEGATKVQLIQRAAQLQLPEQNNATSQSNLILPDIRTNSNTGLNIGLGLPEQREQLTDQTNPRVTPVPTVMPPEPTALPLEATPTIEQTEPSLNQTEIN